MDTRSGTRPHSYRQAVKRDPAIPRSARADLIEFGGGLVVFLFLIVLVVVWLSAGSPS
jgi:hypothetical protein